MALLVGCIRAADVRAFLPLDPEPLHICNGGLKEFRFRSLRVKVFDPENERTVGFDRSLAGDPESGRMAEVEQTGR